MKDTIVDDIKRDIEEILSAKKELGQNITDISNNNNLDSKSVLEELQWELNQVQSLSKVDINQIPIKSHRKVLGKFVNIIKRAIRKSTFWLYEPLFTKISDFNSLVSNLLNKNVIIIDSLNKDISILKDLIQKLNNEYDLQKDLNKSLDDALNIIKNEKTAILNEIENLKNEVEKYKSESSFLRAKLAVALQYINTGKWPKEDLHNEKAINLQQLKEITDIDMFYNLFEQEFRGPEEIIKERQSIYLPDIKKAFEKCGGFALDFGCGRGEFLELCRDAGIKAKGVDLNESMAKRALNKGLDVEICDGFEYLHSIPDESLCAFTAFQVIEHLTQQKLWELLQTALIKLKPGGVIILETVNVDSLLSFKNFYSDLTHDKPIPAQTLKFLVEVTGFRDIDIIFTSPIKLTDKLNGDSENINKLNNLLFADQDYAVKGWR